MNPLTKLEQLEQSATPGPWTCDINDLGTSYRINAKGKVVTRGACFYESDGTPTGSVNIDRSDADLIAHLRNLAPELIALWKAAKAFSDSDDPTQIVRLDRKLKAALDALERKEG